MHETEPAPATHALWSSYPGCINGGTLNTSDVGADMEDSGVSEIPGVCDDGAE